jgi:hypothetical protein
MPTARNPTYQMYRSTPWQFCRSFDLCHFPILDQLLQPEIHRNSHPVIHRNPQSRPLETHLELPMPCGFPGKSNRSRDYLIGQQVTIYYPQWISMGNIYLWISMGNISMIWKFLSIVLCFFPTGWYLSILITLNLIMFECWYSSKSPQ